ncbi:M48 metallopeptidase family protein [Luteipulveratus flavus]|uniref:M48 family metallopeptidase n=1 Tax=Luteipulveratus flavus TaxID=3031728 RepID=A0ABT6CCP5_9MICO|nr:M48 family metallopeptidase [Luteipulveratus sp. YIM 133296]MDF8265046.1 M48 family metallopeptidase [Luteipulveratus sp. YIM 133296]
MGEQPLTIDSAAEPAVEIRRSARRRRTVSAYREGDRIIVLVPARLTKVQERTLVAEMVSKIQARDQRLKPSDSRLAGRAEALSARYLGGLARPTSVRWVSNQRTRWGSCTPMDGTIRLSHRLQGMPEWVVDYVLLHELAHLLQPGHGKSFWSLLDGYPHLARARGFLEGVAHADGLPTQDADDGAESGDIGAGEASG